MSEGFNVGDRVLLGMGVDAWDYVAGEVLDPGLINLSQKYLDGGHVTLIRTNDGHEIWGYTRTAKLIKAAAP